MNQIQVEGIPQEKITSLSLGINELMQIAKTQRAITTPEELQIIGQRLVSVKDIKKQVTEMFAEPKKKAHEAHRAICDLESKFLKPLEEIEKSFNRLVIAYNQEVQRRAREEAERLRLEAEKKAEEERKKLEAQVLKAIDKGQTDKAEALMQKAETIVPIVPITPVYEEPKVEGLKIKQNWTFEIVDASLIPREYLIPDEKKLLGIAKTMKGDAKVPGVRFYDAGSVARAS